MRSTHRQTTNSDTHLAGVLLIFAVMPLATSFLAGCGGKDDAQAAAAQKRPPAKVAVDTVTERKLAPRVIAVGTLTAVRSSTIASGANGVVEKYDASEGQWVNKDAVLSELRMKSSQHQLDESRRMLELRTEEHKESKTSRPEEIRAARFRMSAAETAKTIAKQRHDRALKAYARGAINQEELDEAEQRQKQTDALFEAAKAEYEQLRSGPREEKQAQAKARMDAQKETVGFLVAEHEKRTTRAPFDGYIVKEHTYVGQWLSKGDPVVTLAKLDQMDVIVNVDQTDIRHVQLGGPAKVEVQGFPREEIVLKSSTGDTSAELKGLIDSESATTIELIDDAGRRHVIARSDIVSRKRVPWEGTVVQIVPKSEWKTGARGFPVKVRIDNVIRRITLPANSKMGGRSQLRRVPVLKDGMMVNVIFQGVKQSAFLIHKDALIRSTHGMLVNVYRPSKDDPKKGSTIQIGVQTGISDGDLIQITARPTNEGETIPLVPGQTQIVVEGGERLMPVHGEVVVVPKSGESQRTQSN